MTRPTPRIPRPASKARVTVFVVVDAYGRIWFRDDYGVNRVASDFKPETSLDSSRVVECREVVARRGAKRRQSKGRAP